MRSGSLKRPSYMPCTISMRTIYLRGLLWLYLLGCAALAEEEQTEEQKFLDFDHLPDTNFSCVGKVIGGYYADLETNCQMFHVCTIGQLDEPMDIRFLCLNGTVFDQETRVCERIDEVDCAKSEQFYSLNLELYGNTQPSFLEENSETDAPLVIKSSTTTSTTTTTTERPKTTRPPLYTTLSPTITSVTSKVISTHHFPISSQPDIRFNPAEINISLNPGAPPNIRTKPILFQQQIYSSSEDDINHTNNKKAIVTTHASYDSDPKDEIVQVLQISNTHRPQTSSTQKPKSVVNYGLTHDKNPASVTPADINYGFTYHQTENTNQEYHTEVPNRNYQYQNYRPGQYKSQFRTSTYRTEHLPTTRKHPYSSHKPPTTYRNPYITSLKSPHYHHTTYRTEKPQRLQLPLPLLPTLPPLTFSSPAPFTLSRHIETKRYTNEHQAPPRIIISASASVSDASGRRLNYSLGTIGVTPLLEDSPKSYDDYKDHDVVLDPFYHDVPKIKSKRRKRSAHTRIKHSDVIKSEQEAVDVLKFLFDWYKDQETSTITIPVSPDVITEINENLTPIVEAPVNKSEEAVEMTDEKESENNFRESDLFNRKSKFNIVGDVLSVTEMEQEILTTTEKVPEVKSETVDYVDDNYEPLTYHETVNENEKNISNQINDAEPENELKENYTNIEKDYMTDYPVLPETLAMNGGIVPLSTSTTTEETTTTTTSTTTTTKPRSRRRGRGRFRQETHNDKVKEEIILIIAKPTEEPYNDKSDSAIESTNKETTSTTSKPKIRRRGRGKFRNEEFKKDEIIVEDKPEQTTAKSILQDDIETTPKLEIIPKFNITEDFKTTEKISEDNDVVDINSQPHIEQIPRRILKPRSRSRGRNHPTSEEPLNIENLDKPIDTIDNSNFGSSNKENATAADVRSTTASVDDAEIVEKATDFESIESSTINDLISEEVTVLDELTPTDSSSKKHEKSVTVDLKSETSETPVTEILEVTERITEFNLPENVQSTTTETVDLRNIDYVSNEGKIKETHDEERVEDVRRMDTYYTEQSSSTPEDINKSVVETMGNTETIPPFATTTTEIIPTVLETDIDKNHGITSETLLEENIELNLEQDTALFNENHGSEIREDNHEDENYRTTTELEKDNTQESTIVPPISSTESNNSEYFVEHSTETISTISSTLPTTIEEVSEEITETTETDISSTSDSNLHQEIISTTAENNEDKDTTSLTLTAVQDKTPETLLTPVNSTPVEVVSDEMTSTTTSTTPRRRPQNRRTRPSRYRTYSKPFRTSPRHRFSTELATSRPSRRKPPVEEEIIEALTGQLTTTDHEDKPTATSTAKISTSTHVEYVEDVPATDAPLYKSANPTQAEMAKESLNTTPLSMYKIHVRKEKIRSFIFNCFGRPINKFYSDPRDCRLFHYCTSGYTKNQLLDMKFVCDLGTYFDDEKLICTKTKPQRCL